MKSGVPIHFTLWAISIATSAWAIEEEKSFFFEGHERSALLCSDKPPAGGGAPLILVFHGYSGNSRSVQKGFRIERLWPEALVAYVQGLVIPERDDGRIKPGRERPGWQRKPGMDDDRDLKFIDYLIEQLAAEYKIDRERVFATGFSNGAVFTWVLLAERPNTFAAFAPIAGIDNGVLVPAQVPKPVIYHMATNDSAFKFAWAQKTIRRMKKLNRVNEEGQRWVRNTSLSLEYTLFTSDQGGAPFVLELNQRGHMIPPYAPGNIVTFFKSESPTTPSALP
jgi:polyhydroxybutyrate depolymerase